MPLTPFESARPRWITFSLPVPGVEQGSSRSRRVGASDVDTGIAVAVGCGVLHTVPTGAANPDSIITVVCSIRVEHGVIAAAIDLDAVTSVAVGIAVVDLVATPVQDQHADTLGAAANDAVDVRIVDRAI